MFCVTEERNDKQWSDIPICQGGPYNCCLEIADFRIFSRLLHKNFQKLSGIESKHEQSPCEYKEEGDVSRDTFNEPCYFRKPLKYKEQKERRLVIIPESKQLVSLNPVLVRMHCVDMLVLKQDLVFKDCNVLQCT